MDGSKKAVDSDRCSVVGLGYVGITLAVHLDRAGYDTVGYDIDEDRVESLQRNHDPVGEFSPTTLEESALTFTDTAAAIEDSSYVLVALPTPLDDSDAPDVTGLVAACETVGQYISDGTTIVFESTLYPGATQQELRPAIERGTATQRDVSFSVGYSPERIVPGGSKSFDEVTKVVAAEDEATLQELTTFYDNIVEAGVHPVDSIQAAEATKCLENVQRDVNIGVINEFVLGCQQLDVDVDPHSVLEAARTKWNFHDYRPGIVGGHCIPVDPHYLRHKFERCGFNPAILRSARAVNEHMVDHVCSITVEALCHAKAKGDIVGGPSDSIGSIRTEGSLPEAVAGSQVHLLGFSYKPDVSDVRNSGVGDLADSLARLGLEVSGYDPFHDSDSVPDAYDFDVAARLDLDDVDAVVLLTPHREFGDLDLESVSAATNDDPVLVEVGDRFDPVEAAAEGVTYRRL